MAANRAGKLSIYDENEQLKIDATARWLARHGARAAPAPELTDAQWQRAHYQRFLGSRWHREGRTFAWWLKRRKRLRRINKYFQKKARRRSDG